MKFIHNTYKKMLDEDSLNIARDFLDTEKEFLSCKLNLFKHYKQAVVVGCGDYNYYELIKATNLSYLGIDPLATRGECPQLIKTTFEEYLTQRDGDENKIFIFWFNVISHLNMDLIEKSQGIRKGDLIINSTWRTKNTSRNLLEQYYSSILPHHQKNIFNADVILSRKRSIKGMLRSDSGFSTQTKNNNLFEVAII
ncbi:hypothetical protein [Sodalis ligni]|jgi:hypothetical protein|uniref:Uncharacterized protein n=1 Tax=Sodalis ligni TaxID=2697027 RepID=A0A4R1NCY8_9GAMM|nr:hypothetical protein [Sodalis ligni]TCL05282.1 hypothetical protein EZJ58_3456 [Sodalis ligni]